METYARKSRIDLGTKRKKSKELECVEEFLLEEVKSLSK